MKSPLFAVVLLSAATIAALAQTPTLQINKENRTISVSATDSVTTEADLAVVHVEIRNGDVAGCHFREDQGCIDGERRGSGAALGRREGDDATACLYGARL